MPLDIQNRFRFASAMMQLGEGSSRADAIALLGQPDDIRTLSDADSGLLYESTEMWCYGTDRHLGFPTLGHLYFKKSRVHHFHQPPPPAVELQQLFDEEELRSLLRCIDLAPPPAHWAFKPRSLIQIVNRLQLLGKPRALCVVTEYLRVAPYYGCHDAREGLFLVLRLLFDLPEGWNSYPVMQIGLPHPLPPEDRTLIPRFPITLHGDIPLLLVNGYSLMGCAQPVEAHGEFYAANGTIRQSPLLPTDRPFALLDEIMHSPLSIWLESARNAYGHIVQQLLLAVDSVYRPAQPNSFLDLNIHDLRQWLSRYDREGRSIGLHWDGRLNDYATVTLDPSWFTSTVVMLARQMHDSGDFSTLPILADALQDAGCENEDVLNRCRRPGEHVRWCWVVDLLTGQK